jgi:hypothetical protein
VVDCDDMLIDLNVHCELPENLNIGRHGTTSSLPVNGWTPRRV